MLLIGEDYTRCHLLSIGERLLLTGDLRRATLRGMKVPFYQWLQGKLKELNMTQADVIKNAEGGIKSSQMSRVYNGKGKYDAKTIRAQRRTWPQGHPRTSPSFADRQQNSAIVFSGTV